LAHTWDHTWFCWYAFGTIFIFSTTERALQAMSSILHALVVTLALGCLGAAAASPTTEGDPNVCAYTARKHNDYEPYSFCPDLLTESTGAHTATFYQCSPLPQRRCVQQMPDNFIVPTNQYAFRHNPPSNNVRLSMPDARFRDFSGFAARHNEDCETCWRFGEERVRWNKFLNTIERLCGFKFVGGPIRTALDFGAGAGGFLSALADRGVMGLGFARNWRKLPYLETAAARGVLVMHMDFRNHVPMGPGAVDLVHCSWLMNILSKQDDIEAILMEWDRLVRPGGYIVQYGFRSSDETTFNVALMTIRRIAAFLKWTEVYWRSSQTLFFIYKKPVQRRSLGSISRF
jgi:SAM-dependent methyltransferase